MGFRTQRFQYFHLKIISKSSPIRPSLSSWVRTGRTEKWELLDVSGVIRCDLFRPQWPGMCRRTGPSASPILHLQPLIQEVKKKKMYPEFQSNISDSLLYISDTNGWQMLLICPMCIPWQQRENKLPGPWIMSHLQNSFPWAGEMAQWVGMFAAQSWGQEFGF